MAHPLVHVLSCGRVPYPNEDLVRGLTCSIPRQHLCEIRDTLFDPRSVSSNVMTFPSTYDGSSLGNNTRLSARQLTDLRGGLEDAGAVMLEMDMDALIACKIILGRWLRPSEMKAVFGDAKLVMQRYSLTGATRARISFAIGRAGTTLNKMTLDAGCIYIWFGDRSNVSMYARTGAALERARTMLNRHQATFRGDGPRMVAERSGSGPRKVTLRAMYQALTSRSGRQFLS